MSWALFKTISHWPLLAAFVVVGTIGSGWLLSGRRFTRRSQPALQALPPALAGPLERLAGVVPAMQSSRHRDSLRGVVTRVMAVRASARAPRALPASSHQPDDLDHDLGQLVDRATLAASRLDKLDAILAPQDLESPDPALRRTLHERDRLAARLHEVTAFLDALAARYAAANRAASAEAFDSDQNPDQILSDLRAHIEALKEVEAL